VKKTWQNYVRCVWNEKIRDGLISFVGEDVSVSHCDFKIDTIELKKKKTNLEWLIFVITVFGILKLGQKICTKAIIFVSSQIIIH